MLRSVLRNVQYYLLFFSMLLVLLAFQRLQLLDHPFGAFTDRPNGMIVTPSSPDSAGRVYYGGDESHKIGLFKFRLGLFKFILPTFATDEDSWQVTNELSSFMRVPPPPNKQRKQRRKENFFLRLQQLEDEEEVNGSGEEANKVERNLSVAYMIIIPDLSKTPTAFDVISYHEKAKILSASIARAHQDSPYDYKLYALDLLNKELDSSSIDDDDENELVVMAKTKEVHDALSNGCNMNIIHMLDKRVNNVNLSRLLEETETSPHPVINVLKEHDIVVHLSLNAFLLNPLDDVFELLKREEHIEMSESKVDSYTLDYNQNEEQLFIFKTTSQDAIISYLNSLECRLWYQTNGERQISVQKNIPTIVTVSRRSLEEVVGCRIQETEHSLLLDKCLYDVNFGGVDTSCSHNVSMKDEGRIAHYVGSSLCKDDCSGQETCKWLCGEWSRLLGTTREAPLRRE